jgi:ice-binding like protein
MRHAARARGATLGIRFAAPAATLCATLLLTQTALAAPTAVSLGTAAPFAVLAGDAVTNVPTSVILGDVGLTPTTGAAITGLTCAEVTGTIYTVDLAGPLCRDVNPGLLTTAKNALTTAYNSAAGQSPDTSYAAADNQLGAKTLTAGVYRFTAASTANLIGNLTLSGSSADVWIFQATSTLVTAANSTVTFSGGAQACNVFWQVGSAATLGANSDFAGSILAHDDISVGNKVTVDGRLLAGGQANHAGAVTLIHDTITRSDCAAVTATPSPTGVPGATPTAAPLATPTAAPLATTTAAPVATPTGIPNLAPGASSAASGAISVGSSPTAGPSAKLPSTNSTLSPPLASGPAAPGYLLIIMVATAAIVVARAGRARS